ncbi:hypothetical protein P9228_30915, partial [Mesorhizobium sp. WSM4898]|uniref:hypothetical protein n=1 Tax=Mesorhizobium sp. WSM4898 TaxID=3038544 RepID=UPI0024156126
DGTTVGITGMTARQADALRRLFRPFCPSHCRLLFKVTFTGVVYGGGWHYGDSTKFGGKTANIWIKG